MDSSEDDWVACRMLQMLQRNGWRKYAGKKDLKGPFASPLSGWLTYLNRADSHIHGLEFCSLYLMHIFNFKASIHITYLGVQMLQHMLQLLSSGWMRQKDFDRSHPIVLCNMIKWFIQTQHKHTHTHIYIYIYIYIWSLVYSWWHVSVLANHLQAST
jgi:uncharacterized membrane protein YhaH (DUF805 family)